MGAALLLPGMLQAQVYTIHIPKTELPSRVEWSVAYAAGGNVKTGAGEMPAATRVGDWEVTVALDAGRCEISCVYRRIRDLTHLLPPVTEIRLYTGSRSQPATIMVDPAGLRLPLAASRVLTVAQQPGMPARRLFAAILMRGEGDRTPSTGALSVTSGHQPKVTVRAAVPLRI